MSLLNYYRPPQEFRLEHIWSSVGNRARDRDSDPNCVRIRNLAFDQDG